jgi:two-component sensor histidine kinase
MIFHVSIYFTFLLLIFTYGYLTYTAHPLLHGVKQMSTYVIAMLFVIAFGIFYHIAIEQYYRELETANRQKTFLLKEVHHRVKNNLNIISSILGLQKFETENQEVHRFIDQNRLRLESIALAHETLYKQEDLENINFKTYISKLTKHILTLEANHDGIVLEINSVPLKLSIDTIVQFGIIINELITNSIKYAFPDNKGKISIILKELDGGYLFRYSDDGIGLKEEEKVDGFGQSLIAMSTEQLGGELLLINKNGLSYEIKFKG